MREIQLHNLKAALSAVVDDVVRGEPVVITRHGKRAAVILSFKEWERLSTLPSFGKLLMLAPIGAVGLSARGCSPLRPADF
jgi:prevent-host-death family protein